MIAPAPTPPPQRSLRRPADPHGGFLTVDSSTRGYTAAMKRCLLLLLLCLVWLASPSTLRAEPVVGATLAAEFEPEIQRQLRRSRTPGLSIVVADGGRLLWVASYGYADLEARQPLESSQRWPLGDSTKLLSALLTLDAVQRGELALDAPLPELWPGHPLRGEPEALAEVTPRRLLSHHGGVVANRLQGMYPPVGEAQAQTVDAHLYLAQRPGRIYAYSNLGYVVLGRLLEQRAGRPYETLLRERVLQPLGMQDTQLEPGPDPVRGHDKRRTQPLLAARDLAALGAWGSTRDLGALLVALTDRAQLSQRLALEPALGTELLAVQNDGVVLDFGIRVGFGWQFFDSARPAAGRFARIGIGAPRYRGDLRLSLDHGIAVAVLGNSTEAGELVFELSGRIMDRMLEIKAGIEPAPRGNRRREFSEPPASIPLPDGVEADTLARRYVSPIGLLTLEPRGEGWQADLLGRPVQVRARSDGWYALSYRLLGVVRLNFGFLNRVAIRPVRVDGERMLLAWFDGEIYAVASRFEPPPFDPALEALIGDYRVGNPDLLFEQIGIRRIRAERCEDALCFSYELPFFISLRARVPVIPDGPNHLRIPGTGALLGERLERFEHEGRPALRYSGYELLPAR